MFAVAERALRERALILHLLQPEPGCACCAVEEGEGSEGVAGEALFLEASEIRKKLFDSISSSEQVQKSALEGRGILKTLTNLN